MAFDFPAAPAVSDIYAPPGGPSYTWDGVAWVVTPVPVTTPPLADYVLKAGDFMTGALNLPSANPTATTQATHKAYVDTKISDAPSDTTPYVRQDAGWLSLPPGNVDAYTKVESDAKYVELVGDTMTGALKVRKGSPATAAFEAQDEPADNANSVGLLWRFGTSNEMARIDAQRKGSTYNMIFAIRPSGTPATAEVKLVINDNGCVQSGPGGIVAGRNGYFLGDIWHGMSYAPGVTEFLEYAGTFKFIKRTSGTSGGELLATINQAGVVANGVNVTSSAICDVVRANVALKDCLHDTEDGPQVDLGALLMHALSDLAVLQAKMKVITDLT